MSRVIARLAVGVLILSAVTFAVGTGAFPGASDPVGEEVSLSPSSGPNGEYAYLADGELVVDLTAANPNLDGDGVGDDTVTILDDVFVVRYGGERFARIWITHGSESVTLRADGRPIQSEANAVVLPANGSTAVGMGVDTTGTTDGLLEDLTVHARVAEPGDIDAEATGGAATSDDNRSVSSYAPSDDAREFTVTNAPAGAPVTLDTDRLVVDAIETETLTLDELVVTGDGGSMSVDVRVLEGTERPDATTGISAFGAVEVDDGGSVESATFRFSAAPAYLDARRTTTDRLVVRRGDDGGWETLDMRYVGMRNGRAVFEFESKSPVFSTLVVGARTPDLRVADAGPERPTVAPDESSTIAVSVRNDGLAAGERDVTLSVDDERLATRAVELAPGESATVRFTVPPRPPGRYAVSVDGVDAGTLVVTTPTADAQSGATPGEESVGTNGSAGESSTRPSPTPADRTEAPVGEPAALDPSSIGWLLGAVAAALVVLLIRRRRGGPDGG
jgi:hypothetical protein